MITFPWFPSLAVIALAMSLFGYASQASAFGLAVVGFCAGCFVLSAMIWGISQIVKDTQHD